MGAPAAKRERYSLANPISSRNPLPMTLQSGRKALRRSAETRL